MVINPFLREPDEYKQFMDPLNEYVIQASKYVATKLNIDTLTATEHVKKALKDSDIKDPNVQYYERQENLDKEKTSTSLLTYLKLVKKNKEIIAPSFTSYINSKKSESFQKKFIERNLSKRKDAKKKMQHAKAEGNNADFIYYNVLQKVLKIFNNSLSGAYAIISTVLYNPSAHYTLTSITRAVASIGNAVSEMMISGNRYYKDFNNVINSLTATITHVDMDKVNVAIKKFNLTIPSTDEVFAMVLYSSRLYWKSISLEEKIYDYISKMTDTERTAVMYVNDFYQITKLNDTFSRKLIGTLSKRETGYYYDYDYSVLNETEEFAINLAHHICKDDIRGIRVDYEKLKKTKVMDALVSTVKNINSTLRGYQLLIEAFFKTDIMPIDITDMKDVLRRAIVLSDTDSTCASYNYFVTWYFGKSVHSQKATAVTAAVMTINTQVIDHFLKALSTNMGVEKEVRYALAMKNEFYWPTITPANVSKHYYAGVEIQEGIVFETLERELKGVHFLVNNLPPYYKNKSMELIDDLQKIVTEDKMINFYDVIERVGLVEKGIISTLKSLKPEVLKNGKVKEAKAYTLDANSSAYRYHTLWNTVFSNKYGHVDEPPYTTYDLPVILKNKSALEILVNSKHGDQKIREDLNDFILSNFSSGLMTLKLPKTKIDVHGIPEELVDAIDVKRSVEIIMNSFYIVLETLGFYRKPNMLVCEQLSLE